MKNRNTLVAPIAAAVLLLLTAWGNAIAMFVVSAIGCVVALGIVLRGRTRRSGIMVAMTGFAVAAAAATVAVVMTLSQGP